jgi:hypothetical protein
MNDPLDNSERQKKAADTAKFRQVRRERAADKARKEQQVRDAAPDLLAALKDLASYCADLRELRGVDRARQTPQQKAARAAILKATK